MFKKFHKQYLQNLSMQISNKKKKSTVAIHGNFGSLPFLDVQWSSKGGGAASTSPESVMKTKWGPLTHLYVLLEEDTSDQVEPVNIKSQSMFTPVAEELKSIAFSQPSGEQESEKTSPLQLKSLNSGFVVPLLQFWSNFKENKQVVLGLGQQEISRLFMKQKQEIVFQLLSTIRLMQDLGVVHGSIHLQNQNLFYNVYTKRPVIGGWEKAAGVISDLNAAKREEVEKAVEIWKTGWKTGWSMWAYLLVNHALPQTTESLPSEEMNQIQEFLNSSSGVDVEQESLKHWREWDAQAVKNLWLKHK